MPRLAGRALAVVVVAVVLAGCTSDPQDDTPTQAPAGPPTVATEPATSPTQPATSPATTPAPTPSPSLTPGQPCDPADGSPDCTDATGADDGQFRYIEGYADCVADLGSDEAYGLCTDLDGDGRAGYPDSG